MPVWDERAETEGGGTSPDQHSQDGQHGRRRVLEAIWQRSWGLRLSLGLVAVLVWAGASSAPSSPQPARGTSVSPPVTTPVVAPTSPDPQAPPTVDPAAAAPKLPQLPLDIIYDYGPGPQPAPGAASSP
jgi:hypothetical protein